MPRKLPSLTPDSLAFWQGGAEGRLMIQRCQRCRSWFHPPTPFCRQCESLDVGPEPVSGRGRVCTFTINHQRWAPDLDVPFVVAIVELDEQPGLRLLSNIVGCPVDEVAIGMPVQVRFEQQEDVWIPLFERVAHD